MFTKIEDPSIIEGYLTDASNLHGRAEVLVRPGSTEEVAEILAHCQEHGIPVTVTAGRTSTTGAAVPYGGWLMSMERLNKVIEIGHDTAVAQGGVFLGALQTEIENTGRFFPPDPTSRHECTLGAAIACNASGARTFRYGATRPWIKGLTVVTPTGEILKIERGDPIPTDWPVPHWNEPKVKTAAGYPEPHDLLDLFIGQEGTLGVITEATLELTDLPPDVLGILAFFPDRQSAVKFVEKAREAAKADPKGDFSARALEYLDGRCLKLAAGQGAEVPEGAGAALFCEQEIWSEDQMDAAMGAWWEALEEGGALADDTIIAADDASLEKLHSIRHAIPAGINEKIIRNGMRKVGTDLAVPDEALDEMMDAYEAAPIDHVIFGHIGNNHLHLNLMPTTQQELEEAKDYYDELARKAIALGGTVSAEHGIGKLKRHQLAWMVGADTLKAFEDLKRFLDPNWILGRGNLLKAPKE